MVSAETAFLLGLDAVSFVLAVVTAAFFWRTDRIVPDRGFRVLALAFLALGIGWLAVAASAFNLLPEEEAVDAVRVGGSFLGAALIALNYASRRVGIRLPVVGAATAALVTGALVYVVLYLVVPPRLALPEPLVYLPWLRLVESGLLVVSALLVVVEVRGARLSELRVPLALIFLALEKYTVGILLLYGITTPVLAAWVWRLAALGVLLALVLPLRRWPSAAP